MSTQLDKRIIKALKERRSELQEQLSFVTQQLEIFETQERPRVRTPYDRTIAGRILQHLLPHRWSSYDELYHAAGFPVHAYLERVLEHLVAEGLAVKAQWNGVTHYQRANINEISIHTDYGVVGNK